MKKTLMSARAAADYLGVSRQTIYNLIRAGKLRKSETCLGAAVILDADSVRTLRKLVHIAELVEHAEALWAVGAQCGVLELRTADTLVNVQLTESALANLVRTGAEVLAGRKGEGSSE